MSDTQNNQVDFATELQIEVEAGKTHILEITAKPIETQVPPEAPEKGDIEIQLVNEQGNPIDAGPVYLVNDNGFFTIEIIKDHPEIKGYGRLEDIPTGIYTVTFEKPSVEGAPV